MAKLSEVKRRVGQYLGHFSTKIENMSKDRERMIFSTHSESRFRDFSNEIYE